MNAGLERAGRARVTSKIAPEGHAPTYIVIVFYVYLILEYVRPQESLPIIGVVRPALLCLGVLALFSMSRAREDVYRDWGIRLFIAFAALCWLGLLHAVNTFWAFQYALTMTTHLLAAVIPMCLIIRSRSSLKTFLIFWIAAHCYLATYAILHKGRGPGSFLADENDLALALNVALPYVYYLAMRRDQGNAARILMFMAVALIVAGVIATASRGGFVGLAVTTVLIVWFSKRKFRNLLLALIGAGLAYALVPQQYKAEVGSIGDTQDATRQARIHQWKVGWDMYLDNPVIGVGTGNYPWRVHEYEMQSQDFGQGTRRLHGGRAAHSMYFTLLPEHGTVGALLFLMILWTTMRKLRRSISVTNAAGNRAITQELTDIAARATLVSLGAFLTTGIFISVLYYPPFWYAVGIAYCVSTLAQQTSLEGQTSNDAVVASSEGRDWSRGRQKKRARDRRRD